MKTTIEKLNARVAAMSRESLEELARNVVWSLFAQTYVEEDKGMDEETDALGLKDGDTYLDSDKEWDSSTAGEVSDDLDNAGLMIEEIAHFEDDPQWSPEDENAGLGGEPQESGNPV